MNSKDWKLSLLAIAAVSMLAACNKDKKTEPTSQFAGVWVLQDNLNEYGQYSPELTVNNRRNFCRCVYDQPERYGDNRYRMRAILIQVTGEVYRYSVGDSVSAPKYRERNYMGAVNSAGVFAAGSIGPDGRVITAWNQSFGPWDLPPQTTLHSRGNELTVFSDAGVQTYVRHDRAIIDDYAIHVTYCLDSYRKARERRGVRVAPKDYDPAVSENYRYEDEEYYDDGLDRPLDTPDEEDYLNERVDRRPLPRG